MDEVINFLNSLFPQFESEYKGKLTIEQAAQGIKNVVENAEDLLDDSLILFRSGKYPRSVALAIMAGEEISKIDIIKKILLSDQFAGKSWGDFKSHRSKNHVWYFPVLKKFQILHREISQFIGNESSWVKRIDDLKNNSLYVGGVEKKSSIEWDMPKSLISKDFCGMFLVIATEVVKDDRIVWSKEALTIFKEYHYLEGQDIKSRNPRQFYGELLRSDLITQDRFEKIAANYEN